MKVFLFTFVTFVCVISINCAPSSSEEDDDEAFKANIAEIMRKFLKEHGSNAFAKSMIKSVDEKCVYDKYKAHSLMESYPLTDIAFVEGPPDYDERMRKYAMMDSNGIDSYTSKPDRGDDATVVFANIVIMCSNKLNGLLGFAYDFLFSFSNLVEAFKDDKYVKEKFDDLDCYYKYAIENKFLDPEMYPKATEQSWGNYTEEQCIKMITEVREDMKETAKYIRYSADLKKPDCLETKAMTIAEEMFFKYGLLIPLGISDHQKIEEKQHFIRDVQNALEKLLLCNVETPTATDENNVTDNLI